MTEYLNRKNLTEAVGGVREMKAPKHFLPEMLSKIIVCSLDRPDEDKEHASTLIHALHTDGLITGENFMQVQEADEMAGAEMQNPERFQTTFWHNPQRVSSSARG